VMTINLDVTAPELAAGRCPIVQVILCKGCRKTCKWYYTE
jgi:hypothetical protein